MLEIKNLTCGYDSKGSPNFYLREMSFSVGRGDMIGIIGPNGSGKTTLLRAITGALKPQKGEILLKGKSIRHMGFRELARTVAVVSQNIPASFMTVEEFVLLGRIPHYGKFQFLETKKDEEIAKKYMSMTNTLTYQNQPMEEISGGERQLAVVARALTQEPELLLLDEPTSHLDIKHQTAILDLVRELNRNSRLTVMMVLHDLNLASEYCDRLILLNNGNIHRIGEPAKVLTFQVIEEVYETVVVIEENPISHKPYVLIVSGENYKKAS
jgi:iron complex transport system ATP-binding protein